LVLRKEKMLTQKERNVTFMFVITQGDHMFSYNDSLQDQIETEYKLFCEGEDFNPIKDPEDAVHSIFEEIFEGDRFDEERIINALKYLIKHHKLKGYQENDFEYVGVVGMKSLDVLRETHKNQVSDLKKAMVRHLNMLKFELYGYEEIHQSTVNSAIGNLEWLSDEPCSEKKLTIKRG